MDLRKMRISDYEPVYALWFNTPGIGVMSRDDSREGIEAFLERNPDTCFIALDGTDTVGVILCGHDGRRAYIYHLAVRSDCRGRGIGRSLVDAVISELDKLDINKVALVAFGSNDSGNMFWDRMGFVDRSDLRYRDRQLNQGNIWLNRDTAVR